MSSDARRLTSATELRALSHPIRLALVELLDEEGPLTATQAGERLGESPANASFHLRTLARYGYVEEAPGGRGRQRPWQVVHRSNTIPGDELGADAKLAAGALLQLIRQRDLQRLEAYESMRADYPKQWREAAHEMRLLVHLTAAELAELFGAIEAVLELYLEKGGQGDRRPGTLPISVGLHMVPTRLPADPDPVDLPSPAGSADAAGATTGPAREEES